jgi:cation transport ATPase
MLGVGRRMRSIALVSAVGGMVLSVVGMIVAAFGYLPAIGGAIAQEAIDLVAVPNTVRAAIPSKSLKDF